MELDTLTSPDIGQIHMTAVRFIRENAEERQRAANPEVHTKDMRLFGRVRDKGTAEGRDTRAPQIRFHVYRLLRIVEAELVVLQVENDFVGPVLQNALFQVG